MDLSVIMCTWNNPCRLAITLDAVGRCRVPPGLTWELVLANNGSADDVVGVARAFARSLPLVYVEEPRPGLSRAKNAALRKAAGRFLIFADDDVTPCRDWIAAYWTAYTERPAGYYFGGPIVSEYENGPPDGNILRVAGHSITGLDWGFEARALSETERVYPANWGCPAAAIEAAGDFDPDLGLDWSLGRRRVGETFDVMDRLAAFGMSAWYVPEARVTHFVPGVKCTIEAVGQNAEAVGRYSVRAVRPHPFLIRRPHLSDWCARGSLPVAAIPWPLFPMTARLTIRWLAARARGQTGYEQYVSMRFCAGQMKGYRDLRRRGGALTRSGRHRPGEPIGLAR
jgi:hypothetical protein